MILLPLQDVIRAIPKPRAMPWAYCCCPFGALGVRLNKITKNLVFCINIIIFAPSELRLRQLL